MNTTTAPVTKTIRVTVRTKTAILKGDLTLDEAVAFLEMDKTPNRGVTLPSGGYMDPSDFRMWVRSMKAAEARNAARMGA